MQNESAVCYWTILLREIMMSKPIWQKDKRMRNVIFLLFGSLLFQFTQVYSKEGNWILPVNERPAHWSLEAKTTVHTSNMEFSTHQHFINFKKSIRFLDELHIDSRNILQSSIEITYPNNKTIWTIPDPVEITWKTKNIPDNKTIKFYLSKDDIVVQELGTFKNNNFVSGVKLNKALQTGDNYRVIGIELFPRDKFRIAKFATSYFTINKPANKEVKAAGVVKEQAPRRNVFEGRTISYVKELVVDSKEIRISLWDHGRKDGDMVSIYLNGEAIVSKYLLTYQKKHFDIKLDATKPNDLFLYAHNLGKFPPNTVSIEITDGKAAENIILNSDLKSCEAILISVKE